MSEPKKPGVVLRTFRFFGREAGLIAGSEHVRMGARVLNRQWTRTTRRVCPACQKGRMYAFSEEIKGEAKKFLGCSMCEHYQAVKIEADPQSLDRLKSIMHSRIDGLTDEEREQIMKRHRQSSRFLYAVSLMLALFGIFMIGYDMFVGLDEGGLGFAFVTVMALCALMFVQGMGASYRFWQVRERVFFVPGAFKRWLRLGQWLI